MGENAHFVAALFFLIVHPLHPLLLPSACTSLPAHKINDLPNHLQLRPVLYFFRKLSIYLLFYLENILILN